MLVEVARWCAWLCVKTRLKVWKWQARERVLTPRANMKAVELVRSAGYMDVWNPQEGHSKERWRIREVKRFNAEPCRETVAPTTPAATPGSDV